MSDQLTHQDVVRLLKDPSPAARAEVAAKVSQQFQRRGLTPGERKLAEDIIRAMARDAVVLVRRTLSDNLKNSHDLPRDVALTMARDVEEVALPVLAVSKVLSDQDLIDIIKSGSGAKMSAIASRERVSAVVSDVLIARGDVGAVAVLVGNEGAEVSEAGFNRVLDRFGEEELVQGPLVHRNRLPLTVAERLVALVSDSLQEHLVTHHDLPPKAAADLLLHARERATGNLFAREDDERELEALVQQLAESRRLTPSLLIRALCTGDMPFFEMAMARLSQVPLINARMLVHDTGQLGLKSIYKKAGLPAGLFPIVRIGIDIAHETTYDGGEHDRERHRRRTIERILTKYEEFASEDVDYLLDKLSDLMPGMT